MGLFKNLKKGISIFNKKKVLIIKEDYHWLFVTQMDLILYESNDCTAMCHTISCNKVQFFRNFLMVQVKLLDSKTFQKMLQNSTRGIKMDLISFFFAVMF